MSSKKGYASVALHSELQNLSGDCIKLRHLVDGLLAENVKLRDELFCLKYPSRAREFGRGRRSGWRGAQSAAEYLRNPERIHGYQDRPFGD